MWVMLEELSEEYYQVGMKSQRIPTGKYSVGFFSPSGSFHPIFTGLNFDAARSEVHYLNGGNH